MILYGLSTCPVCTRAQKTLAEAGIEVTVRDVRRDPMSADEWAVLLAEFGDNLVDRKSQAYRNLNAWMRESEADAQLADKPKVMARPVIEKAGVWTIGWKPDVAAQVLDV